MKDEAASGTPSPRGVTVVVPAHNEAQVIAEVVRGAERTLSTLARPYEILVIDDGSDDGTGSAVPGIPGVRVIRHPIRMGNGAAVKTGLRAAAMPVTVIMDGDGQHDPAAIPAMLPLLGEYAMVVGARGASGHQGFARRLANLFYSRLASYVSGHRIPDLTSGFRAMSTEIARHFIFLLPNGFSSPTTLTLSFLRAGHAVAFHPIAVSPRVGRSKIRPLRDGLEFLQIILKIVLLYAPFRLFLPLSVLATGLGIGYYIERLITVHRFTNMSLLLILAGILFFVIGLVAEQLTVVLYGLCETYGSDRRDNR